MINHKKKYIFIHIPKTGGTSIEKRLLSLEGIKINHALYPLEGLTKDQKKQFNLGGLKSPQHKHLNEFEIRFQKEYFSFAFVRNPWARAASSWLYHKRAGLELPTVKSFLLESKAWPYHKNPQVDFLNENINFIGRFESLQEDFDKVCNKIGIPQQTLPHSMNSPEKDKSYKKYFDNESIDLIHKMYQKDIEMFGYEF